MELATHHRPSRNLAALCFRAIPALLTITFICASLPAYGQDFSLAGAVEKPAAGTHRGVNGHSELSGWIEPAVAAPGETVKLILEATPLDGFHLYALAWKPRSGNKPVLIVVNEPGGLTVGTTVADQKPKSKQIDGGTVDVHLTKVRWTTDLSIPQDAAPGVVSIGGLIEYQTCSSATCDMPAAARFQAKLTIGQMPISLGSESIQRVPLDFTKANYADVEKLAAARPDIAPEQPAATRSDASSGPVGFDENQLRLAGDGEPDRGLLYYLAFGFLGGIILNLMPCVLPVVGLKILSFVEQSQHDRWRVIKLNLWYTAGLMSVFLALATVPVVTQLAFNTTFVWGQQFGNDAFNIALAAIVFVMALSMLGVWEIPIPGFIGSSKAHGLTSREGVSGAFFKGVITTLLATPCTGPFMATAISWALRQPPIVIYLVFGSVGLGMASPYLVIGAFPKLVRFLPKPGAWMDTFKQLMGFVLLGTVVYLLTFIDWVLLVPTVAFLMGLWAACWWIGRTSLTAELNEKLVAWGWAVAIAGVMGLVSFSWLNEVMAERFERKVTGEIASRLQKTPGEAVKQKHSVNELPWQPFSKDTLRQLAQQQLTVMVDFTADWCPNCKTLEKLVLNTEAVKQVVEQNGIVPLMADFTKTPPEIADMLEKLQSGGVPVLAIFPAGRPNEPIVFREVYTQQQLLDALRTAGPSQEPSKAVALRPTK